MSAAHSQVARSLVLTALLTAVVGPACQHGRKDQAGEHDPAEAVVTVRTAPAATETIEVAIAGIGRTEALPDRLVTLTPALAGHVHEIQANLGDLVHQGDVIVQLDATVAEADLAAARANRDTLRAALDLLEAPPRAEDRKGLEIAVEQAKAAVGRAQAAVDRLRPLRRGRKSPRPSCTTPSSCSFRRSCSSNRPKRSWNCCWSGRAEAVAEAVARLAGAEQAVGLAHAHRDLLSLRSPIDGVLDSLSCHPGQALAAGTIIGEVVDARRLNVVAWLPPASAARVKPGQTVRVELPDVPVSQAAEPADNDPEQTASAAAEPSAEAPSDASTGPADTHVASESPSRQTPEPHEATGPSRQATGKVVSVGRIVDSLTGNLPVRMLLENADQRLAIGQTVSVSIVVAEHTQALVVPSAALIDLGDGPVVVVVREGKAIQLHPAAVSLHGAWTIISGTDLQSGEPVIIDGGFNLPDETPVLIETAEQASPAESRR